MDRQLTASMKTESDLLITLVMSFPVEHSQGNVNNFLGFFEGFDCTNLRKCPHQTFLPVPREQEGRKECVPSTEESYFAHISV